MTRHEIREEIMKGLFQANFYEKGEMDEQFSNYFEDAGPFSDEDTAYIDDKTKDILDLIVEIDAEIDRISEGWQRLTLLFSESLFMKSDTKDYLQV